MTTATTTATETRGKRQIMMDRIVAETTSATESGCQCIFLLVTTFDNQKGGNIKCKEYSDKVGSKSSGTAGATENENQS